MQFRSKTLDVIEETCESFSALNRTIKICVSLEQEGSEVKICVSISVDDRQLAKECYGYDVACYTLIERFLGGRLKVCISDVVIEDGVPECFRVKLVYEPPFGGERDIYSKRYCFTTILDNDRTVGLFTITAENKIFVPIFLD